MAWSCRSCRQENSDEAQCCRQCGHARELGVILRGSLDHAPTIRLEAEQVVASRYRIIRTLGEGGMGFVYLAQDLLLDCPVALRFLPPAVTHNRRAMEDLEREANLTLGLTHSNIVRVHTFEVHDDHAFLDMEYVESESLEERIARKRKLTPEELLPITEQVAGALDYAHGRRVLHRDIKPSKILIANDGTAKLADFGISRELKDSIARVTGQQTGGTLLYMAPEVQLGQPATPAADVYSLAATLYEALSGRSPFQSGNIALQIQQVDAAPIEGLPEHVNAALLAGLLKQAAQRPRSGSELCRLLRGEQAARREKPPPRKRRTAWVYAALVCVLAGLIVLPALTHALLERAAREPAQDQAKAADQQRLALAAELEQARTDLAQMKASGLESDLAGELEKTRVALAEAQRSAQATAGRLKDYEDDYQAVWFNFMNEPVQDVPVDSGDSVRGKVDAPHTIVMYLDLQCPYCQGADKLLKEKLAKYPNQLRLVVKHFPLDKSCNPHVTGSPHRGACAAAVTVEAARAVGGDQAYWKMYDELFAHQGEFAQTPNEFVKQACGRIGIDNNKLWEKIRTSEIWDRVKQQVEQASRNGVDATPTVFYDGRKVAGWANSKFWDFIMWREQRGEPAAQVDADRQAQAPAAKAEQDRAVQQAAERRAQESAAQAEQEGQGTAKPRVEMRVRQGGDDWGRIVIECDEEKAPITVRNFLRYVDEGFYDGTVFHRVIPSFMIQGGGYKGIDEPKQVGLHEPIQNEAKNGLKNARGTVAMARARDPHSATSQFFINVIDNSQLDFPSFDDWGYAVFGKVVEGMDVVDRIRNVERRQNPSMPNEKSVPLNPPVVVVAQRTKADKQRRSAVDNLRPLEPSARQTKTLELDLGSDVKLELVLIAAGEFSMGSPDGEKGRFPDEGPPHQVRISRPFYLGKYEVTQAQWKAVMGTQPSHFKGDNLPVETVSWDDCQEFCRRLSQRVGRELRLPAEAEWEYACRAGATTAFSFGESLSSAQANFDGRNPYGGAPPGEFRQRTTPVGSFRPNGFGLYDMHGNVWEWSQDPGHSDYAGAPTEGSAWIAGGDQSTRVLRGGSWDYGGDICRSAYRGWSKPDHRSYSRGFRLAAGT